MRNLHIISVNHKSCSATDRIKLNLEAKAWERLFTSLVFNLGVEGYVHLQTCNRIEIFYDADHDVSKTIVSRWINLMEGEHDLDTSCFQMISGQEACIQHLLELYIGTKRCVIFTPQRLGR